MARSETRQRMIETAMRLFQRDGYRAASWRRLIQEAGTPWGSAHHHFPGGKEQLGVAAVNLGAGMVGGLIAACFEAAPSPAAAIQQWFATSAALLEAGDFREGCPVAGVALEVGPDTPELGGACAAALAEWTAIVRAGLLRGGHSEARAGELAMTVVAGFEGGLLLARALRSTDPLLATARQLAALSDVAALNATKP